MFFETTCTTSTSQLILRRLRLPFSSNCSVITVRPNAESNNYFGRLRNILDPRLISQSSEFRVGSEVNVRNRRRNDSHIYKEE